MRGQTLVLGATGKIGRGVVAAAVAAGRPVLAVARDSQALAELAQCHPRAQLRTLAGSVADDRSSARLAEQVRALDRPIDSVVAVLCGGREGARLLDADPGFLHRRLRRDVLPHLHAARHLLPLLAQSGRGGYVLVAGPGGSKPWAGYGHHSIASASLHMLARVLHEEARSLPVRVQLLAVESPACSGEGDVHACRGWPTALAIGERALALAEQVDPALAAQAVVAYAPGLATLPPAQAADSADADDGPACLHDARAFLQRIFPSSSNEVSPR